MTRRLAALVLLVLTIMGGSAAAGTITVPAGGDLQAALNAAQPGDTILLAAGATYTGNFILPAKSGTAFITIRSDAADANLPPAGTRITPAYARYLPKLQSASGSMPALTTAASASYYAIQFLEFLPNPSGAGAMIELGRADSTQTTLSVVPHDLVVDRCYLHSAPGVAQLRGIALNSGKTTIQDSYIAEIKYAGQDSQAIAGWNGPGPYTIVNNYLEAAGENFLMGGSTMLIPNVTPTGITFSRNYCTKQTAWRNSSWTVKNIFELKHAQDVTVDGNIFEYNWLAAQPGYAIVFTPRNQYNNNSWTVVQRVAFTNNIVRHVASVFNILGWDNNAPSQQTNHITIRNNVFEDVSATNWGGNGRMMLISQTCDVTVDHNTSFNENSAIYAYGGLSARFVFTNNIVSAATYGIMGDATGEGNGTIATYFTDGIFQENLFVGTTRTSMYPAMSFFPASMSAVGFVNLSGGDYHLSSSSPYKAKGTDGKDPGADIDALQAALANATPPPPPSDYPPTVSLTAPSAGASFTAPASVTLAATAADSDATPVARVDFYANGALVGTATSSPYSCTWSNVAAGTYSLTAVATDTANLTSTSAAVSVTVASSGSVSSSPVPSPWTDGDIGAVGLAGSASYSNGTFTARGAGADVWGSADSFNFTYQALNGDGQIVARVASIQNTNAYAKAGVMVRETLAAGSAHAMVDVKPGSGIEFLARATTGGATSYVAGASAGAPVWVRLSRAGTSLTASYSTDGATWTTVGTISIAMAANVYVGLAVCSHDTAQLNTSTFDNVTAGAAPATQPPPASSGLTDKDVGAVGLAGSMSATGGIYTIKGAGSDIWGTSDAFNYAYQSMTGDGQIVARVTAVQNTNPHAKAGVMIRAGTAANAAHVLLDVKPGGGVEFLVRTASGGSTTATGGTGTAPVWLKLVRAGSTFTAYTSSNGSSWTKVGSATVSMASSVSAGLAVCSHNTSALNTSTFDNLSIGAASVTIAAVSTQEVVLYASDVPAAALHSWTIASDAAAAGGTKLSNADGGWSTTSAPLAAPTQYVDVTFTADAGKPYAFWLRMQAAANSKYNDSVWLQFSDAVVNGAAAYALNSTSALLVNLENCSGCGVSGWGWQNGAYWLTQPSTVTFAAGGTHTLRIQVREDGSQIDQVVLSAAKYLTTAPGGVMNDSTIVSK